MADERGICSQPPSSIGELLEVL